MIGFIDDLFYNLSIKINLLSRPLSILILLLQASYNFSTFLLNWNIELTQRFHVSCFLCNLEKNRTEITSPSSSSIIMCLSVAAYTCVNFLAGLWFPQTCIATRCLAMEVSEVLLCLNTSGVQASCHSIHCCQNLKSYTGRYEAFCAVLCFVADWINFM
jgi:hypothetical protein